MRNKFDLARINRIFIRVNRRKIQYLFVVLASFLYIVGIGSKGVMNVDFYVEWTRATVHGNLFEIYNVENGKSVSAENATLIVPYPPLSLYLLGLRLYRTDEIPLSNLQRNCPPNYEFFFASILVYKKIGLQINQVPIRLEARGSGESKMTFGLMRRGVYRLFLYTTRIKRIKL